VAKPDDVIPYFLVEVTVSGAIIDTESRIVGDNVVDTTHQFAWRADDLPAGATDDMVTGAVGKVLTMVSATIQLSMTSSKWVYLGSVEEPDLGRGEVVRVDHTGPIKVLIPMPDQPEARA
jgi:hypothetical protein